MSAQTGVHSIPPPPPDAGLGERLRASFARLTNDPNPIWIRELKQSVRRGQTPIVLMVITGMMSLLLCAIGGIFGKYKPPATVGTWMFQTFFAIAYFVVMLFGPALAANAIVAEREGRTWEAVLLTGMRPAEIARGKFLAALTTIGSYIVMLAPVGALPFLFGGVTATEVVAAFAYLFLLAVLAVAFGLAVSSKMQRLGAAIVVTLMIAVVLAVFGFSTMGIGMSFAAHSAWPRVVEGTPVWLPTAYERAPFGLPYFVFLVVMPLVALAIPAWFLYEATVANLTSIADDRSTGLKRWFTVTAPVLAATACIPIVAVGSPTSTLDATLTALGVFACFLAFAAFVFTGEPIGPSRRVRARWDLERAGRVRRFLGPGLARTSFLVLVAGLAGIGLLTTVGAATILVATRGGWSGPSADLLLTKLAAFATYAASFFVFVVGFASFLRARTNTAGVARVLLLVALFVASLGPWLIAAIAGLVSDGSVDDALVVAAPSPFYVGKILSALDSGSATSEISAGIVCTAGWAFVGLLLFSAMATRCRKIVREHAEMLARADAMLEAEDRARAEALATPDAGSPDPEQESA